MTKVLMRYLFHRKTREKVVTTEQIVRLTREEKYTKRVSAVRGLRVITTEMGMSVGLDAAEDLPLVFPAKGEKGGYTGLVLLSFRVKEGMDTLEHLRQTVNLWPQTLLSFVGTSGQSLKVLIAYRLKGGGLPAQGEPSKLFHQYAYRRAAEFAYGSTGVKAEEVLHDGTEHFRVSADPKAYHNPDVMPIEMDLPSEPLAELPQPATDKKAEVALDTEVLPGYTRRETDVIKFNFVCRDLAFGRLEEPDVQLMQLARACCKAGIDKELAITMTIDMGAFFKKEILVRTTFNTAYEQHPLGMAKPIELSLRHQLLLEEFLFRRYMFRRNKVTGDIEYQEKFHYRLWWKPLTEEAKNDMNNAAIREGIKVWPKDLERLLISERIHQYDPVREWLEHLPAWDGRDRLGELAARVRTQSPDWTDNFKIWMRSMVSQWRSGRDALYGAQMVLMLVGGQGTRKSTFMRMLLPKELMPFYIDRIDFANKKEALRALSRFLLINIDEYDQISKAQTAFLKHLIQRTDVKERKLYSTTFEQQQRYAAFCATTNSLMPLKDESGSRRYLVVEVDGVIDTDVEGDKRIDYQQLYAQIVFEIEHGEEYAFTGERERKIVAQNSNYYETPNVVALFEDRFRRPRANEQPQLMSVTELLQALKVDATSRSNATLLGSYLHRNGYQRGAGEGRRRYQVVTTF